MLAFESVRREAQLAHSIEGHIRGAAGVHCGGSSGGRRNGCWRGGGGPAAPPIPMDALMVSRLPWRNRIRGTRRAAGAVAAAAAAAGAAAEAAPASRCGGGPLQSFSAAPPSENSSAVALAKAATSSALSTVRPTGGRTEVPDPRAQKSWPERRRRPPRRPPWPYPSLRT